MKARISKSVMAIMATGLMMGLQNPYYMTESDAHRERNKENANHRKDIAVKNAIIKESQPLQTFTIKGIRIEAKSRKDAIKILKHKGFLK